MTTAIERFDFHGDALDVARDGDRVLVSIRRVCEALGVDTKGQLAKLHGKRWAVVEMVSMTGPDGKTYDTACLSLDSLPMWLATIEPTRVALHVRPKLDRFQVEAHDALADHFLGRRGQPLAHADHIGTALATLASNTVALTTMVASVVQRLDAIEGRAEMSAGRDGTMGAARAKQIARMVKQIVDTHTASVEPSKRVEIARGFRSATYSALRTHIGFGMRPKLDRLPESVLPAALNWLDAALANARRAHVAAEAAKQTELPLNNVHPLTSVRLAGPA